MNFRLFGLSRAAPGFGRLDTVVHGVSQEMHDGIFDGFEDVAIDFRRASIDLQRHGLAARSGEIPDHPYELAERGSNGHHPDRAHVGVQ
jgi:hypothetical protein